MQNTSPSFICIFYSCNPTISSKGRDPSSELPCCPVVIAVCELHGVFITTTFSWFFSATIAFAILLLVSKLPFSHPAPGTQCLAWVLVFLYPRYTVSAHGWLLMHLNTWALSQLVLGVRADLGNFSNLSDNCDVQPSLWISGLDTQ